MKSNLTKLVFVGLPLLLLVGIALFVQDGEKQEQTRFQELTSDALTVDVGQPESHENRYQIEIGEAHTRATPKVKLDFLASQLAASNVAGTNTLELTESVALQKTPVVDEESAPAEDPIPLVAPNNNADSKSGANKDYSQNAKVIAEAPQSDDNDKDNDKSVKGVDYEVNNAEAANGFDLTAPSNGPVSVLASKSDESSAPESEPENNFVADTTVETDRTESTPPSIRTASAQGRRWLGGRQPQRRGRTTPPLPLSATVLPQIATPPASATSVAKPQFNIEPAAQPTAQIALAPGEQIISEDFIEDGQPITSLPPAIRTQIQQRLDYGTSLAKRGAFASAEEIYLQVIRLIAETKDSQMGVRSHTRNLADGLTAFEESQDFASDDLRTRVRLNVPSIVQTHTTTLLQKEDCEMMTPIQALQRYYEYVSRQFVSACDHEPIASEALYYLGKLYATSSQIDPAGSAMQNAKSMIMQQASMETDNMNHRASNELGVLLARYGRLDDAREMLIHSVSVSPTPVTWENLSKVHAKLGEGKLAELAANESNIMLQQESPGLKKKDAAINWVSPEQFAAQTGNAQQAFPAVNVAQEQPAQAVRVSEKPAAGNGKAWWQVWKR